MTMHIDKEFINPKISRTIWFTPVLYEWLEEIKEREGISFNHAVLQLAGHHFLRIHKNYLVDQEYIKEVGKREVYLTDGKLSRHP